ncbi:MAG: hypothetical protein IT208_04130 [Chthonomonadales bacterium]|nr:hypothetical protein [Chthonomonadales bacterium]
MKARELSLTLRVVCIRPPLAEPQRSELGLQDASGGLLPGASLPDGSLVFECEARVPRISPEPVLAGPHIHGRAGSPFLYVSLRDLNEPWSWRRRMKVPLTGIDGEMLLSAAERGDLLEAAVMGTARGELPSGTVPLLGSGWVRRAPAEPPHVPE